MGGELKIRVNEERMPPPVEGLDAEDGVWRLSLEPHRDLLVDIAGVEPTDELTRRELETVRARLEGYVEREKRTTTEDVDPTDEREPTRESAGDRLRRLLSRLLGIVPLVEAVRARESSDRRGRTDGSYSVQRVRRLAQVFRAAIATRRADISCSSPSIPIETTSKDTSSVDAVAD
ncbi:hypothetical protein C477_05024 [Haloterrigena salina JCM 13891]|uniref:Uncharacterized protein n=1 Tax=Haloterrigena salina JCM 13891 TaxID=1227488 RepID=M0CH42_9EURY|nr:hypothetical protein [Haloterrigena salina]ELZ21677.1 hypothetical protein C477_05024 [Haloterrigena salina JCM 13891]